MALSMETRLQQKLTSNFIFFHRSAPNPSGKMMTCLQFQCSHGTTVRHVTVTWQFFSSKSSLLCRSWHVSVTWVHFLEFYASKCFFCSIIRKYMISLLPRKMKSLNKTFTLVSAGFETCQDQQRRLLFEEKMENEINKAFLIKTRPSEGSRAISLLRRRILKMYRQNQKKEQISCFDM